MSLEIGSLGIRKGLQDQIISVPSMPGLLIRQDCIPLTMEACVEWYCMHAFDGVAWLQEAHVFSTTDGMALEVFVVEGWDGDDVSFFLTCDGQ
jgi:hypothetical protein